jgi:hypothetical protein
MRRLSILFSIVLVFAFVVVAAATAAAPDFCDEESPKYDPNHPSCDTTTPPTPEPPLQSCENLLPLSGHGYTELECAWTPENDGSPSSGVVTLTVAGDEAVYLAVFVRDSSPGNICALEIWNKPTGTVFTATFPLADIRGTYWGTGGEDWCAPYDEFGPKEDLNGEPLNLRVILRGKKTTTVEIALDPVQKVATP